MKDVHALILTGYGLNCDYETAFCFERAGAVSHRIHINSLISGQVDLAKFDILVFGGGFSWGDDHGAGVVQAVRMKMHIGAKIQEFIAEKKLIIGICNGFQTLVNIGLLPGIENDYEKRSVALTFNDCGNFRDQWVYLRVNPDSSCVFTKGMQQLEFPIRHGEGKFVCDPSLLTRLKSDHQIVIQYAHKNGTPAEGAFPANPNGSMADIAGICDPSGRIFGLMPHPEAFNHWTNHPDWTRIQDNVRRRGQAADTDDPPGIMLFKNAVDYVRRPKQ